MPVSVRPRRILALACFAFATTGVIHAAPGGDIPDKIVFNRDVRPILSENCFHCHGFDAKERKGDRRLDTREGALAENDGFRAIVPGKPTESELWLRILSEDKDEVMPPPKSDKHLAAREREILKRWIEQGAEYEVHWAYVKPEKPAIDPEQGNPVDQFVAKQLSRAGLRAAPEADRRTLIRRLSFDLIGLPPKPEEVEAFLYDPAPDAYKRLVETYLSSPHYGERMAIPWLDVVRYADTIGYHSDNPRNVWPYRDYVIRAFNENKPFDQFTREQLAGDLLPGSTKEQKVASAFNRLLLTTEEGGAQPKDYESRMLTDRVRAVGSVWLGATIGCAQCHDHKFDPIKSRDFYTMGAFFADIKEPIVGKVEAGMVVATPEQEAQLASYDAKLGELQAVLDAPNPELDRAQAEWEQKMAAEKQTEPTWVATPAAELAAEKGSKLERDGEHVIRSVPGESGSDVFQVTLRTSLPRVTGVRLEALRSGRLSGQGPGNSGAGNFVLTEFSAEAAGQKLPFSSATATYEQKGYAARDAIDGIAEKRENGWAVQGKTGADSAIVFELKEPLTGEGEKTLVVTMRQDYGDKHTLGKFRLSLTDSEGPIRAPGTSDLPKEVGEALAVAADSRTAEQKAAIAKHYRSIAPALAGTRDELAAVKKKREAFEKELARCLTTESMATPRAVRILPRGNWMDESGEVVQPALPSFLPGADTGDRKLTRLDLAEWIVSPENPLTARVFVNRVWKQFFGIGLSKVLDDFGAQGEPPVNLELLDWLASEFRDSGWNVKHIVRTIVLSRTYRQASTAPRELQQRDPENRLLARQSRWRLDAELVRDNALAAAGLLVPKVGGPSVMPYQPEGYWENLNFPPRVYKADTGEAQYRRGLYTHWQRSFLHPSMLAFDAPTREECAADRVRSNIPQQALVLLNDPTYVEAARTLAARILKECAGDDAARMEWAFRQVLQRAPRADEMATLVPLLEKHRAEFAANEQGADAFLKVGLASNPPEPGAAELAAWTSVARVLLNLHETITRP